MRTEIKSSLRGSQMRLGKQIRAKAANTGGSSFTVLPCTLPAVLPVLLTSIQETRMCYLVFLLDTAIVHFGGVDNFFPPHCIDL